MRHTSGMPSDWHQDDICRNLSTSERFTSGSCTCLVQTGSGSYRKGMYVMVRKYITQDLPESYMVSVALTHARTQASKQAHTHINTNEHRQTYTHTHTAIFYKCTTTHNGKRCVKCNRTKGDHNNVVFTLSFWSTTDSK